jgi:hypothetical protein
MPRWNGLKPGGIIDEPPVAKFAPCLKLVPSESKYAFRYCNFSSSAALTYCNSTSIDQLVLINPH